MDWRFAVLYLQVAHALFGGALLLSFVLQGWLGLRIRRRRRAGTPDFVAVRRHRRLGPVLTRLLPLVFLAGLATAYLDHGAWVIYPLHLAVGAALVLTTGAAELLSRRIRGPLSPWRFPHLLLGAAMLALFLVQAFLGLGILL
jgi:uncharacterized protein DUF4079